MFQLLVGNVGKIVQLWNFVLMEIGYLSKNYLISVKYTVYIYIYEKVKLITFDIAKLLHSFFAFQIFSLGSNELRKYFRDSNVCSKLCTTSSFHSRILNAWSFNAYL